MILTDKQRDRAASDRYSVLLEAFRRTGRCQDWGNGVYDWLDKRGLIGFTNAQKNDFVSKAIHELHSEANEAKMGVKIERRVPFEVLIRDLKLPLAEMPPDTRAKVISRAKQLAINEYFRKIESKIKNPES
jgi:hypothetical protein